MSDHQTRALLERVRDDVPVHPAPVDLLVADALTMRRRRRTGLVSSVAAAGVAVILGASLLPPALSSDDSADPSVVDTPIEPPAGSQLVGVGDAAIAIPDSWSPAITILCTPESSGVVYYADHAACGKRRSASAQLEITPTEVTSTDSDNSMTLLASIDDHEIVDSGVNCDLNVGGDCWRSFGVPDLDAYFTVTIDDADTSDLELLDRVRDSLVILNDGQAVVPRVQLTLKQATSARGIDLVTETMQSAGFAVTVNRIKCDDTGLCLGGIIGISPTPGAVAPAGSTVTVDVN